jgi:hypothetical protein
MAPWMAGAVAIAYRRFQSSKVYYSISELAARWRCSRGSIYNRLR